MLNRIGRFIKKVRSRKGYTLVEAATVVAITGAMAIVAVPIASDKIEDSKISVAGLTTQAISTAFVKFFGDTGYFPIAKGTSSFSSGAIKRTVVAVAANNTAPAIAAVDERVKILRSGLGVGGGIETTNTLDPELNTSVTAGTSLGLWDTVTSGSTTKANAGADATGPSFNNLNSHLVTDSPGYSANGSLNWFGPYMPSVDQDPWGRNYLVYVRALDPESLATVTNATGAQTQVFVPRASDNSRIFAWVISAGPDEKLQTAPNVSILSGDDIGTIISIPPVLLGQNDAKKDK